MCQFIIILFVAVTLIGCGRKPLGAPVLYVVPVGYRGTFSITLDPTRGISVPMSNGQFVVTVPATGKLTVRSFDFLHGKHELRARYADGEALSTGHREDAIAVRIVRPDKQDANTWIYVVGTSREQDEAFGRH